MLKKFRANVLKPGGGGQRAWIGHFSHPRNIAFPGVRLFAAVGQYFSLNWLKDARNSYRFYILTLHLTVTCVVGARRGDWGQLVPLSPQAPLLAPATHHDSITGH